MCSRMDSSPPKLDPSSCRILTSNASSEASSAARSSSRSTLSTERDLLIPSLSSSTLLRWSSSLCSSSSRTLLSRAPTEVDMESRWASRSCRSLETCSRKSKLCFSAYALLSSTSLRYFMPRASKAAMKELRMSSRAAASCAHIFPMRSFSSAKRLLCSLDVSSRTFRNSAACASRKFHSTSSKRELIVPWCFSRALCSCAIVSRRAVCWLLRES
mmetsp:Transcript_89520/g.164262  ORF Transcript_89520/g.164262 Transcript_89520/m.164262 type:complete len:215 (+) Transcript_89520:1084-1728(+)